MPGGLSLNIDLQTQKAVSLESSSLLLYQTYNIDYAIINTLLTLKISTILGQLADEALQTPVWLLDGFGLRESTSDPGYGVSI